MKFESRTVGVFEMLVVHLEGHEVFDAGRLRQAVTDMVETGHRRLVVDLTGVDYLYSDAINAFIAVNRRMIESSGRLGILAPNGKVHEILIRAGIENILRIYRSESELIADSREIMRQSSSYARPADLPAPSSQAIPASLVHSQAVTPIAPPNPEDSGSFRVLRRRAGSRPEVRPRRSGGRALDSISDVQLPPDLEISRERSPLPGRATAEKSSRPGDATAALAPTPKRIPPASSVPEFILPDGTIFDPGGGSEAITLDLTSSPNRIDLPATDQGPSAARESAFLDPPLTAAEKTPASPKPVEIPRATKEDPSSFRADFAWDEPPPPPAFLKSQPAAAPTQERTKSTPTPPPAPSTSAKASLRFIDPVEDAPTLVIPAVSPVEATPRNSPQVVAPPEPVSRAQVVPPPEPVSRAQVVAPPEPVSRAQVVAPPEPVSRSQVVPPPEPVSRAQVVAPPEPVSRAQVVAPPEPVSRSQVAPPPEPVSRAQVVAPPEPVSRSQVAPPPEPVSRAQVVAPPEPVSRAQVVAPPEPVSRARVVAPPPPEPVSRAAVATSPEPTSRGVFFDAAPSVLSEIVAEPKPTPRTIRPIPLAPIPRKDSFALDLDDEPPRKSRSVVWLVLVLLVVLLGLGVWWILGSSHGEGSIPEATTATVPTPENVSEPPPPVVKSKTVTMETKESKNSSEAPSRTEDKMPRDVSKKAPKVVEEIKPKPVPIADPADKKVEKVFLTSRPSGAKVLVDGKSVGKTPVEAEIRGSAHLTLSLDGYKPLEKDLRLADVSGTVNLVLEAESDGSVGSTGKFFLSTAPAGAEILYQGKVIGKTPKMVELPAGNRTLILRSGALSHTVDLEIREGSNPAQHVPL